MPRFGFHIDPPLAAIPGALADLGAITFQTTLRDPRRLSKDGVPDAADQAAYLEAAVRPGTPLWGMVHASMLISLGSPDPRIRNGSASALAADANLAATLGMAGVCFHVGYQKGHPTRDAALAAVARKLGEVLLKLQPGAQVWLENGCEGTELGQTVEEIGNVIATVVEAGGDPSRLGVVLDTCHLHVAGFDMAAPEAPERLAEAIERAGIASYLRALHLNDAQAPCGSHRDRHAAPGEGTIGAGLRAICAHPLFAPLPAILEIGLEDALRGIEYLQAESH
jgi:apurinic endonuclease APN1